ncbi:MAG: hypothetical protein R3B09_18230 [Nannocystaceae bacterium]
MRWIDEREDPRGVAALRIALGVCLLGDIAGLVPHLDYLYGDEGVWPAADACGQGVRGISILCHVPAEPGVVIVFALALAATLAFTLGIGTRVTKWITAALFLSIFLRNNLPMAGQQVLGNFLFLLCLSRCGAAYSIDAWIRRRRLARRGLLDDGEPAHASLPAIPAWPRRLMIVQLCVTYGVAGWLKSGATYDDGTAFYYLVSNDRWYRFPPWWWLHHFGDNVMRWGGWFAPWFERLFPLCGLGLLLRRRLGERLPWIVRVATARRIWATLSIVFTGSLLVFANLGWFVPATAAATLVLFRGEEVGRVVDRLLRRGAAPTTSAAPVVRGRVERGLLIAFITWHVAAVMIQSLDRPPLKLPVPAPLRGLAKGYGGLTNTWQFWGMFQGGAPTVQAWVAIDVIDDAGVTHPAFDDRVLLGGRRYPYLGMDRRQKFHSNFVNHDLWRIRHIEHLCRTWRGPEGRRADEVVIRRISWRLLPPWEMARLGPRDPGPEIEPTRRERTLRRGRCGAASAEGSR